MRIIETLYVDTMALFVSGEEYGTLLLALEIMKEKIEVQELLGDDMTELKVQTEPMRVLMTDTLIAGAAKEAAEDAGSTDG